MIYPVPILPKLGAVSNPFQVSTPDGVIYPVPILPKLGAVSNPFQVSTPDGVIYPAPILPNPDSNSRTGRRKVSRPGSVIRTKLLKKILPILKLSISPTDRLVKHIKKSQFFQPQIC